MEFSKKQKQNQKQKKCLCLTAKGRQSYQQSVSHMLFNSARRVKAHILNLRSLTSRVQMSKWPQAVQTAGRTGPTSGWLAARGNLSRKPDVRSAIIRSVNRICSERGEVKLTIKACAGELNTVIFFFFFVILRAHTSDGAGKKGLPWMFTVRQSGRVMSKYFNICFWQNTQFCFF